MTTNPNVPMSREEIRDLLTEEFDLGYCGDCTGYDRAHAEAVADKVLQLLAQARAEGARTALGRVFEPDEDAMCELCGEEHVPSPGRGYSQRYKDVWVRGWWACENHVHERIDRLLTHYQAKEKIKEAANAVNRDFGNAIKRLGES